MVFSMSRYSQNLMTNLFNLVENWTRNRDFTQIAATVSLCDASHCRVDIQSDYWLSGCQRLSGLDADKDDWCHGHHCTHWKLRSIWNPFQYFFAFSVNFIVCFGKFEILFVLFVHAKLINFKGQQIALKSWFRPRGTMSLFFLLFMWWLLYL